MALVPLTDAQVCIAHRRCITYAALGAIAGPHAHPATDGLMQRNVDLASQHVARTRPAIIETLPSVSSFVRHLSSPKQSLNDPGSARTLTFQPRIMSAAF